jgi:hypothetical protein
MHGLPNDKGRPGGGGLRSRNEAAGKQPHRPQYASVAPVQRRAALTTSSFGPAGSC